MKIFGSGVSVSATAGYSRGGSKSFSASKSKSTSTTTSQGSVASYYYNTPGGAMVVGFIKRYRFDRTNMPANVTVTCSNGFTYNFETNIKLTSKTYGKAFYHSYLGEFDDGKCTHDRVQCLYNLSHNSLESVINARSSFSKCFPTGIGKVMRR